MTPQTTSSSRNHLRAAESDSVSSRTLAHSQLRDVPLSEKAHRLLHHVFKPNDFQLRPENMIVKRVCMSRAFNPLVICKANCLEWGVDAIALLTDQQVCRRVTS